MSASVPVLFGLFGCPFLMTKEEPTEGDAAHAPSEVEAAAPAAPEPAEPQAGFVLGVTTLRKIASDDRKMPDPAGGDKQVSNWVATLYRGEEVSILGAEGEWSNVRASDDSEGWIHTDRMVVGADTKVGTLFDEGKVFARPDLLALEADRTVEAGALVFVVDEKEQFSQVDYPRSGFNSAKAWTLTSGLVFDANEVAAAKLIAKVRHLRSQNDASAKQLEDLARSQFGSSRLIALLDQPIEGVEGEGEGGVEGDGAGATPP